MDLSSTKIDMKVLDNKHDSSDEDEVGLQQLIEAGERLSLIILSNLVIGLIAVYLIWDTLPPIILAVWIGAFLLSLFMRVLLLRNYKQAKIETLRAWNAYFIAASFFSGLIWGAYGVLFQLYGQDAYRGFEVFILGGMAAGSISTSSSLRWNYFAFIVPMLSMLVVYFFVQGDTLHQMMAAMVILFIVILGTTSTKFRRLDSEKHDLLLLADRTIERLRRSEQHMKDMTSSMSEGMFTLDASGNTDYINPTALQMLGYSAEELLGKRLHSMVHGDTHDCPIEMVARDDKRIKVDEDVFIRKDGRRLTVRYSAAPIELEEQERGSICVFSDITTESRVRRMAEREHLLYMHGPVVVFDWIAEEGWPVDYVSSSITQWGYDQEEFMYGDIAFSSIVHEDDIKRIGDEVTRFTEMGHRDFEQYYRIKTASGEILWVYDYTVIHRDEEGDVRRYYGYLLDVTELKNSEMLAKENAQHDPLTGIYNRQSFDEEFLTEFTRMRRYGIALSLIMFDIDHFKEVNDTYGHLLGDSVLKEVSSLIGKKLRSLDFFVRWGGEEFMVLLPETTASDAIHIAEKMRKRITEYDFKGVGHISSSFGVVDVATFDDMESCLSRVDELLYKAKQNGRDRVES